MMHSRSSLLIAYRKLMRESVIISRKCHHSEQVRVRFAPSPTGQIHIGGLRTALYNYMFARSYAGKFILRIEDTDQDRLVPGAMEKLINILEWAGIHIDEGPSHGGEKGPYIQSQRLHLYKEKIGELIQKGLAYPCFCTHDRLERLRKQLINQRMTPKYDNRCRHLSNDEVDEKMVANIPHVIRFKLERCDKPWIDLVYGPIHTDVAGIEGDPVMMKSDGYPTYHFANVVDDHLMEITHVLRGVEWQVSTKKHLLLYEAFGWKPPQFGHLPLLVNKDGKKLSKRENDIHVEFLKNKGYFPETVQNFLCYSGSGFTVPQLERKGMSLEDLTNHFSLKDVNTRPSKLDFVQLKEINGIFLNKYLNNRHEKQVLVCHLEDIVRNRFKNREKLLLETSLQDSNIEKILNWAVSSSRISFLEDLIDKDREFLWTNTATEDNIDVIRHICKHGLPSVYIKTVISDTQKLSEDQFNIDTLKNHLNKMVADNGFQMAEFMKVIRLCICGSQKGPPVGELIAVLGKEATLFRLKTVQQKLMLKDSKTTAES